MAVSITSGVRNCAVPLLSRLMRASGNISKLDAAISLLAVIAPVFTCQRAGIHLGRQLVHEMDVCPCRTQTGHQHHWPGAPGYGLVCHASSAGRQRSTEKVRRQIHTGTRCHPPGTAPQSLYLRKMQWVRYRTAVCLAKFMKGRQVRAVWMQFEDCTGKLSKQRLLSTCATLSAEEVFQHYARRWSIEDLFNQMKNRWGWREKPGQQSRQVLHRWTQILSFGIRPTPALGNVLRDQVAVQGMMDLAPWRKKTR